MDKWFDDKTAIEKLYNDGRNQLQFLNELFAARSKFYKETEERLSDFYMLYQIHVDCFGQNDMMTSYDRNQLKLPNTLFQTREELFDGLAKCGIDRVGSGWGNRLPTHIVKCVECGERWTIDNFVDFKIINAVGDRCVIDLTAFVGKTLSEVKDHYSNYDDAIYKLWNSEMLIRNDKYIDLSPKPKFETLKVNEHGWVGYKEGINDDYIICDGDEGYFSIFEYRHKSCNKKRLKTENREYFKDIFKGAGIEILELHSIVNEYSGCIHREPWLNILTDKGTIKIGWRKRVTNIDFSEMDNDINVSKFIDDDVTKGKDYIHAWTKEKCVEYLKTIYNEC